MLYILVGHKYRFDPKSVETCAFIAHLSRHEKVPLFKYLATGFPPTRYILRMCLIFHCVV